MYIFPTSKELSSDADLLAFSRDGLHQSTEALRSAIVSDGDCDDIDRLRLWARLAHLEETQKTDPRNTTVVAVSDPETWILDEVGALGTWCNWPDEDQLDAIAVHAAAEAEDV